MTPEQFIQISKDVKSMIDHMNKLLNDLHDLARESEIPPNLRPATLEDVQVGAILWFPNNNDKWRVIEEVVTPVVHGICFKSDGCFYTIDDGFVQVG